MRYGLKQVSFSYRGTSVLRDVSWTLPRRGVVCLWGPSGGGKTTLLRLLAGLEHPKAGAVTLPDDGRVAMVFQEDRLLPWMTALENVMLPGAERQLAEDMLRSLGLGEELHRLPGELSGGQQRRVAIARALAAPGDLLLLDEPFNGLDEVSWRMAVPLILQRAEEVPVVLVTHVEQHAQALNAEVLHLEETPLQGVLNQIG